MMADRGQDILEIIRENEMYTFDFMEIRLKKGCSLVNLWLLQSQK